MDESMVVVKVKVVFSKEDVDKAVTYREETRFDAHFEREHKKVQVGLKLGGAFDGISAALGLQFKKTTDTASANAYHQHTMQGRYENFQDNLYQVYRTITTSVIINGNKATLEEKKYVDALPKNASVTNDQWQEYFEKQAITYIQDHFNATDNEIDKSGDGASFGQAFCTLGINNSTTNIVNFSSTFKPFFSFFRSLMINVLFFQLRNVKAVGSQIKIQMVDKSLSLETLNLQRSVH